MSVPLRQRQEEIRSKVYLDGSRGQPCTLRFLDVCNRDPETTVPCHVHDENFGMGQKAHDISVVDGCSRCHSFLDHGWVGKISEATMLRHVVRALQETLLNRVNRKIVIVKIDRVKPHHEKPTRPRKPRGQRAKVQAGRSLPKGRGLQSGNNLRRKRKADG